MKSEVPEKKVMQAAPATTQAKTPEQWLDEICHCSTKFVGEILATGQLLCQAKQALKGQWDAFKKSEKSPFTARKVDMLICIASNSILADAQVHAHFPDSWTTLYVLSGFKDSLLAQGIADGKIHPRMAMKDAKALDQKNEAKLPKALTSAALQRMARQITDSVQAWAGKPEHIAEIVISLSGLEEKIASARTKIEASQGCHAGNDPHVDEKECGIEAKKGKQKAIEIKTAESRRSASANNLLRMRENLEAAKKTKAAIASDMVGGTAAHRPHDDDVADEGKENAPPAGAAHRAERPTSPATSHQETTPERAAAPAAQPLSSARRVPAAAVATPSLASTLQPAATALRANTRTAPEGMRAKSVAKQYAAPPVAIRPVPKQPAAPGMAPALEINEEQNPGAAHESVDAAAPVPEPPQEVPGQAATETRPEGEAASPNPVPKKLVPPVRPAATANRRLFNRIAESVPPNTPRTAPEPEACSHAPRRPRIPFSVSEVL